MIGNKHVLIDADIPLTDHQVIMCQVNGSADTCEPCPPGTFMDDTTDSQFPSPCIKFNCPPGKNTI